MRNIFTFSLKRSGQHAIINWICKQESCKYLHINDCGIVNNTTVHSGYCNDNGNIRILNAIHNIQDYDLVVRSFEDKYIEKIPDIEGESIIILRDPFNLLASRFKKSNKTNLFFPNDIWSQHAQCEDHLIIYFNKWFFCREYRKEIARKLGIKFTDNGLEDISWYGFSSFNGYDFDKKAQEMDMLDRWKEYENDDYLWNLVEPDNKNFALGIFDLPDEMIEKFEYIEEDSEEEAIIC